MATAYKIYLSTEDAGIFNAGVTEEAALKVNEVLQDNLERHHIVYNMMGFHNHTAHHILTLFALGASADQIEEAYSRDRRYQKRARHTDEAIVEELYDKQLFMKHLQIGQNYPHFLAFFQREISQKGVAKVLNEYLFVEDECAEEMLLRMFTGLLHPIIHLGFGIEFNQPALVAEGLAQACLHADWLGLRSLLPQAEHAAGGIGQSGGKSLFKLLDEIQEDHSQMSTTDRIRGALTSRASENKLKYISQFKVAECQMEEKLAEMMNAVIYYTAAAQGSQRFDFVCLHAVTSSIFFSSLLAMPSLSIRTKLRLLEWKGRMDLMIYMEQKASPLSLSSIKNTPSRKDWPAIFHSGILHGDDGHTAKLIRAIAHAEQVCRPFEKQKDWRISGDMWLKIGNMSKSLV
ncbi:hypothetical protein N7494_008882 [Penicillium frequentans]|uniref:HypA-like protein n=1 Tax=Penicillium frequentans TaxID=3151616 RepID=A0AAD6CNZ0_9EURO|nr:hypothetical protein N7494_008882 [Penicillium glabrum]